LFLMSLIASIGLCLVTALPVAAQTENSPQLQILYAGKDINIGTVSLYNDADHLYVEYTVNSPWLMNESHLHAACSAAEIPQTGASGKGRGKGTASGGNPVLGHFDYQGEHDPPVSTYSYSIDLNKSGFTPGDEIYLAAHAAVTDQDAQKESAWAASEGPGTMPFPGKNWATYFTYTIQEPSNNVEPDEYYELTMYGNVKNIGSGFRVKELATDPNNVEVTFSGTIDASGLQENGAVLIGLLDKKYVDEGNQGWMGGAYVYFGRIGNDLRVGLTDGNFNGEIVSDFKTYTGYFAAPSDIYFTLEIHNGNITVTLGPESYVDSYGEIKDLNNTTAYTWDEFEYGAYIGIDTWPYGTGGTNDVAYDIFVNWPQ